MIPRFLLCLLLVSFAICQPAFSQQVSNASKRIVEESTELLWGRIKKTAEWSAYVKSLNVIGIQPDGQVLLNRGMQASRGLPDATLLKRHRAMTLVLDEAPDDACAQIFRGGDKTSGQDAMARTFASNRKAFDLFNDFMYEVLLAALRDGKSVALDQSDYDSALVLMILKMPAADAVRFRKAMEDIDVLSESEACWAGRMFYKFALSMPRQHQSVLVRSLLPE